MIRSLVRSLLGSNWRPRERVQVGARTRMCTYARAFGRGSIQMSRHDRRKGVSWESGSHASSDETQECSVLQGLDRFVIPLDGPMYHSPGVTDYAFIHQIARRNFGSMVSTASPETSPWCQCTAITVLHVHTSEKPRITER